MRRYRFTPPPRGQTRYDWATGDRWWGPDHVHPKHPDEPINYAGWFEWAAKHGKTHRNVPCPTPGCPILCWSDDPPPCT